MKRIAVILLSYNSLEETTKPCLESIYTVRNNAVFEVVFVDNFSTDGTRPYLSGVESKYPRLKVILNDRNYGYAAGNNIGIKALDTDYYILLNNDTVVTDFWLDKLVEFMEQHPDVGMAGPVSNAVGNEQVIHLEADNEKDIIRAGEAWAERCVGDYFYTSMLGFFCVAVRKKVFDTVGMLDENFGIGMFEDDDFCLRVIQKGFKLACVEDVFIYHKGNVSFKNSGISYNDIFYRNLKKFEAKHGVKWRTGCSAPPFLNLLDQYIAGTTPASLDKVLFKITNKLTSMKKIDYPRFNLEYLVDHQGREYDTLAMELNVRMRELSEIKSSFTWKTAEKFHSLIDKTPLLKKLVNCVMGMAGRGHAGSEYLAPPVDSGEPGDDAAILKSILKTSPEKPVIVSPPLFDWDVPLFQRPQQIAISLGQRDFLYFYCTENAKYDRVEGFQQIAPFGYLTNKGPLVDETVGKKIIHLISTDNSTTIQFIDAEMDKGNLILYEYIDEIHAAISGVKIPESTIQKHKRIINDERCIVIASADKLFEEVRQFRVKNCALVTNGVDLAHFSQRFGKKEVPGRLQPLLKLNKPVIGYYGALASWFDYELVTRIARERPEYEILIIGFNYDNGMFLHKLDQFRNISVLEPVHYKELPRYAFWFDVSIIPFRINEITESTSPIKLFEYMALGKPIVTTPLPECRKYRSVLIGEDHDGFITRLDEALKLREDASYTELLRNEAQENAWEAKATVIGDLIKANLI